MRRLNVRHLATHKFGDGYIVRESSFSTTNANSASVVIAPNSGTYTQSGATVKAALNSAIGLSATVTGGTGPFTYQWKAGGVDIGGATASTYSPPVNALTPLGTAYTCVVTDSLLRTITSNSITVIVQIAIFTDYEIAGEYVELSNVTLEATVFGTGPFTYQWLFNGNAISGATTNPLSIYQIQLYQTGIYSLVVTKGPDSAVSDQFYVQVISIEDAIAPTVVIAPTSPAPQINQGATLTLTSTVAGTGPLTFKWRSSADNITYNDVAGQTAAILLITNAQKATHEKYYKLVVTSPIGTVTSNAILPTIYSATAILSLSGSFTGAIGNSYYIDVVARGQIPLSYQWQKRDGGIYNNIPGATNLSLQFPSLALLDAGDYKVVVTNGAAVTATSGVVTITVDNLLLSAAGDYGFPVYAGSNVSRGVLATGVGPFTYQWQYKSNDLGAIFVDIPGATLSSYAKNPIGLADSGTYKCNVSNGLQTKSMEFPISVLVGDIGINVANSPIFGGPFTIPTSTTTFSPFSYQWYLDDVLISGATSNTYTIGLAEPALDGKVYKVVATNIYGSVNASWTFAGGVVATFSSTSPSIVTAGDNLTITNPHTAFGSPSYSWKKDGVTVSGATGSSLNINPVLVNSAANYKLTVTNAYGSSESPYGKTISVENINFTAQPANITAAIGGNVGFLCTATGPGTITYQWFKNGVVISGATNQDLIINNLAESDVASYYCVATNIYGSRQSVTGIILLTVNVTATLDFTIPARENLLTITVTDTYALRVGQIVYIDNDGGVGFFTIQQINSGNQLVLLYSTAPSGGESLPVKSVGTLVLGITAVRLGGLAAEVAFVPTDVYVNVGGLAAEVAMIPSDAYVNIGGLAVEVAETNFVPANINQPYISGITQAFQTLTANVGTWQFSPSAYYYQWYADGSPIFGAESSTYTLTLDENGKVITVGIYAENAYGANDVEVLSTPTRVIGTTPVPLTYANVVGYWDANSSLNTEAASTFTRLFDLSGNGLHMNGFVGVTTNFQGTGKKAATFNGSSHYLLANYTGNIGTLIMVFKQNTPNLSSGATFNGVFTGSAANPELISNTVTAWYDRNATTGVATNTDGCRIGATFVNKVQTGVIPTGYVVLSIRGTPASMTNLLFGSDRFIAARYANHNLCAAVAYSANVGLSAHEAIIDYFKAEWSIP